MTFNLVFVHLLNDFSGSPKILNGTITAMKQGRKDVKLYVGSGSDGILSSCKIPITRYWYHRSRHRILTLFTYFFSQAVLFIRLLFDHTIDKNALLYINTLLPFGAALYGRLTGRKVIYHVHEISITPPPLRYLLTTVARITSSINLYVSDAHVKALPITGVPFRRMYNALDMEFIRKAADSFYMHRRDGYFNVLMIAYLRDYKGVPEFLALAERLLSNKDIRFDLVVNDDQTAIERYFIDRKLPSNLAVHPRTTDTAAFYGRASLLLSLSRVDQCVETFGLTILEAMAFGIPTIVPPVGGPIELVQDGVQGFHVSSYDSAMLCEKVLELYSDEPQCLKISDAARQRASDFAPEIFAASVCEIIDNIVTR